MIPGTYRPAQNKDNDYQIDREAQKRGETYSGVFGFGMQDASLQESMGLIVDRSRENLVPTDYGIVMTRNKLRKAATELAEKGIMPTGRKPEHMKVRSGRDRPQPGRGLYRSLQRSLQNRYRQGAGDGLGSGRTPIIDIPSPFRVEGDSHCRSGRHSNLQPREYFLARYR